MIRDHAAGGWLDFVRPANADLNLTLALALVSMAAWLYFILRYAGLKAVLIDLFGNKADRSEIPLPLYLFLYLIFFAVGLIEIISILMRPVSLSFRLFGNIFGGENLMHSMSNICQWGLPIPFYFLEMLIGLVQALVFTLLVSVYIGLICNHGDDHAADARARRAAPITEPFCRRDRATRGRRTPNHNKDRSKTCTQSLKSLETYKERSAVWARPSGSASSAPRPPKPLAAIPGLRARFWFRAFSEWPLPKPSRSIRCSSAE